MKGKDKIFSSYFLVLRDKKNAGKSVRNIDPWFGPNSPTRVSVRL